MPTPPEIKSLVVGLLQTNCYVVSDSETHEAIVIDPGDSADQIARIVSNSGLHVVGILNTHCHGDHILANGQLRRLYECPLMIHELDAPGLIDGALNLASVVGHDEQQVSPAADRLLNDGDLVDVGNISFRVIHTPGHTPGGICLYTDGILLSGDTLFAGSIGRSDFPGGSYIELIDSIRRRLFVLPGETRVLPGHGPSTTLADEIATNPFL